MRTRIIEDIQAHRLIAIVRGVRRAQLRELAEALFAGGIRLMELTFSADGGRDRATAEDIRLMSDATQGRMHVGAGTVLTPQQVTLAAEAGARFIISPDTHPPVIEKTRELGLVSIPGAMTPTEIQEAHRAGADFVKLFPAATLGTGYIKDVTVPLSHVKLLAVGGIDVRQIGGFLRAGVCGFGIGGRLVDKALLAKGDFEGIAARATAFAREVKAWQYI